MTMSASFHMRAGVHIETELHRDSTGGYLRLTPGDNVYPTLSLHGDAAELRALARAADALAERCEQGAKVDV